MFISFISATTSVVIIQISFSLTPSTSTSSLSPSLSPQSAFKVQSPPVISCVAQRGKPLKITTGTTPKLISLLVTGTPPFHSLSFSGYPLSAFSIICLLLHRSALSHFVTFFSLLSCSLIVCVLRRDLCSLLG